MVAPETREAHLRRVTRRPFLVATVAAWVVLLPVHSAGTEHLPADADAQPSPLMPDVPMSTMPMGAQHAHPVMTSSTDAVITGLHALMWPLMLVAMMTPLVVPLARHLRARSFPSRRRLNVTIAVVAYFSVWTLGLLGLLGIAGALEFTNASEVVTVSAAALIAFTWQCSPVKQRCLIRKHAYRATTLSGPGGSTGALELGVRTAWLCMGSCWALMVMPLVTTHTLPTMVVVSLLIWLEEFANPGTPHWRLATPNRTVHIAFAFARMWSRQFTRAIRGRWGLLHE